MLISFLFQLDPRIIVIRIINYEQWVYCGIESGCTRLWCRWMTFQWGWSGGGEGGSCGMMVKFGEEEEVSTDRDREEEIFKN